ncbi:hypothetical protein [Sphingomonas sp. PWP1-2]|uniref:hypothetical protein n=1 Tax=Sphingomonas sp. PWP1-2 TaxID=2804558 RepID=UPI003CE86A6E
MTQPRKTHAGTRGKPFAPGNPGRVPGSRNRATVAAAAMLDGDAEALTRKAIELGLEGDTVALRLCLERLVPPRKDSPIVFDLPPVTTAADVVSASAAVLSAVGAGEISPDEAGRVMTLLTAHRAIIETSDHAERLAALEAAASTPINRRRA